MERLSPHAQISSSSRRRLARWLVGLPISVVERDLILETLAGTHGNRTVSARLLGVSVRTLRNKISEYSAEGFHIPRHESRDKSAEIVEAGDRLRQRGRASSSPRQDVSDRPSLPRAEPP